MKVGCDFVKNYPTEALLIHFQIATLCESAHLCICVSVLTKKKGCVLIKNMDQSNFTPSFQSYIISNSYLQISYNHPWPLTPNYSANSADPANITSVLGTQIILCLHMQNSHVVQTIWVINKHRALC